MRTIIFSSNIFVANLSIEVEVDNSQVWKSQKGKIKLAKNTQPDQPKTYLFFQYLLEKNMEHI